MIHKCYDLKFGTIVPDVKWWRHDKNEIIHPTLKIKKCWPSIFSRSTLFDPAKIMFLAHFQHCLEVRTKRIRSSNDFLFPFTLACKTQNYHYYFISFRTLKAICVWMTTRIDLIFSEDLQGIEIYSKKYGFYITMFWLKAMAQNPSKSRFFQFFRFWSVKYIHNNMMSSNLFWKLIWSFVKTFAKFHYHAISVKRVIKVWKVP